VTAIQALTEPESNHALGASSRCEGLYAGVISDEASLKGGRMSNAQVDPRQLQVDNPICPKCGRPMVIVRIEPDEPGHQKRTYECSECELVENLIVKHR
jgi:predicted RNA-binding Zn-ribbon protein involved in translation (DUF1610 family)